jgi:short-subunit dehydrogenase
VWYRRGVSGRGDCRYARALVTGASRGIGEALARGLAASGAEVVLVGRDAATLGRVADAIGARGGRARALPLDVADGARAVAALRAIDAEAPIDLVVANAGVGAPAPDATPYAWETIEAAFHTNFCGAAATLTALLPAMVGRGRGHLVGVGSLASFGPLPGAAAYCAPKAGLAMLLACLRLDLAGTGVAVTTVNLGFVRTAMVARSTHPMPQLLEPDEVAARVLRALPRRPRELTIPRGLGAAARLLSLVPEGAKAGAARRAARAKGRG